MGGRELAYNITINDNNLQNYLEQQNNSYRLAREIYNQLLGNNANPLTDYGVSGNKQSFIIILLEKIIRNTNLIYDQNVYLEGKISNLEQEFVKLNQQGFEPIITAGNKITNELKIFEKGFQDWNIKFENYTNIFNTWNTGFKNFEDRFEKLENFFSKFTEFWNHNINKIQTNLDKLEGHITQFNNEVIEINNNVRKLENDFYNLQNKQPQTIATTSSSSKQLFQVLPSNNHIFKY